MPNAPFPGDLPIIQAPMAGVQDSALTIAVSRGGGVGSLPCAMLSAVALIEELEAIRASGITLYNLNFFCHRPPLRDAQVEARWRGALAPYFREYQIDPTSIPEGAGRVPFSSETLALIAGFEPPIVSFHFGLPDRGSIDGIKSWGGQIWSSATTADEARWLMDHGADAIIAQGIEAGGHRGMFLTRDLGSQLGTMTLLEAIQRATTLPVIAAGGLSTPEQAREALDAGAWAVQAGTAYLCCNEAKTTQIHRNRIEKSAADDTQLTNLLSGGVARGIPNRLMRDLGPMSELAPPFPLASTALAPLRAAAEARGRDDFSPLWCGTQTAGCRAVSAGEQTRWLAGCKD
ncbi:NAD(P)H-dependent flavin oxidoreductase [Congregibacter litoralis]|uniref:Propionate 3-nitronate monooxygenase n=1 Tax=Congregibacter litoralis KT71 TaxID=314285 RepID=A4A9J1_9GAMM|nr:nitronate monooxygenase [Congregibacter litoralis]EAQ97158.1 Dioxygenase [Congregibacter litoralis KT71]